MFKLIRLEWKKNQIGKYIRSAFILTAVLLVFTMLIVGEGELELDESIELYGTNMINAFVELMTHMSYIVFTGVMLSTFVVNDFGNRTVNLLFSYPVKRQKLMMSKILAVWIFNQR
ncbi:MAG: ABC transporter permease [Butyrivibrio sp.]|nr:ABC transporter permease [Muribaculum sp.]MCM1551719.1 ABC transporter permease [Butyrivibrio sp.]